MLKKDVDKELWKMHEHLSNIVMGRGSMVSEAYKAYGLLCEILGEKVRPE